MSSSLCRLWLLLLLLCSSYVLAEPIALDQERIDISSRIESLIDPDGKLTLTDVMQPDMAQKFETRPEVLQKIGRNNTAWLKATLQPDSAQPQEWWLELQMPAATEQMAYYYPKDVEFYTDGERVVPLRATDYRNPLYKIVINDGQPRTFYMKVHTGQIMAKDLVLWEPSAYARATAKEEFIWGIRTGICILLILTALWFERAIRDGVYLYFALYVICVVIMNLPATSSVRAAFGADYMRELNYMRFFGLVAGMVTSVEFLFRFVGMRELRPRLSMIYLWTLRGYALLIVGIAVTSRFETAINLLSFAITFLTGPLALLILVKHVLRSNIEVRLPFFIACSTFVVAIMLQFLAIRGYVRNDFLNYSTATSSVLVFLTVFYAITKRYQRMREANENAQSRIIEMVRSSERELEKQVAERTQALLVAMEEVEKALAQERAAHEEQQQFIAMVSHELRTPLAVIDAAAQNMTREGEQGSAKAPLRLEKIHRATERLSSLFTHYLSSERLKMFGQGVQATDTTLHLLLEDAVNMAKPFTDNHKLLIDSERVKKPVRADADILRLVISTLLNNAVKYTPSGSTVVLRAEPVASGWHIDVTDNGPGIAADEREKIFNRYYRGRVTGSKTGTGLGLTLARHLIERHGGTLELLDSANGGSTFRIFLPADDKSGGTYKNAATAPA